MANKKDTAKKECVLTANTNGPTDRSSWYELFKAAVAVDMVCVRSRPSLVGIQVGIGEFCFFVFFFFFFWAEGRLGGGGWEGVDV